MALQIAGAVGIQNNGDSQATTIIRQGRQGDVIVSELHGRFYEAAYRGGAFVAATQAAVTFAAGLSATAVFGLRNPAGSGKNLVINSVQATFSAAPAAATALLHCAQTNILLAAPSAVTALTTQAAVLGSGAASVGVVFSAATLAAAPSIVRVGPSIVAVGSVTPPYMNDEIAGQIIIAPGAIYVLQALTAASALCSISWEEVSI